MEGIIKKWQGAFLVLTVLFLFGIFNKAQAVSGMNGQVHATAIQTDGKILAGGQFTTYNDTTRNNIARLNTDGTLDESFNPGSGSSNWIQTVAIQSDGKILIGGAFTSYNGISRSRIARLNTDGTLDTTFNPGNVVQYWVQDIAIQSDGKILIVGYFNNTYGGVTRKNIVRLNTDGTIDTTFNAGTGTNELIDNVAIQSDGRIIVGGGFTIFGGISRSRIARLNTDGTLDTTFNPGAGANSGGVGATAIQSDGKIIIGGSFATYDGVNRSRIARLNADGTLDTNFNPGTGTNDVYVGDIAIQSDGKILIGGSFSHYDGMERSHIARLNNDGSIDASFIPSAITHNSINAWIDNISIQPDGKAIIGGNFDSIGGTEVGQIARLNISGSLDAAFNNSAPGGNSHWETYRPQPANCLPIFDLYMGSQEHKDNLVVIVHGWDARSSADWAVKLRNDIISHTNSSETVVGRFDWGDEAATGDPWQAYSNAFDQGRCLAKRIAALHISPQNIHLVGHSAGSNVIQTAVDELVAKYKNSSTRPFIQLTFLDAFAPGGEVQRYGDFSGGGMHGYSLNGYAEQYVDVRLLGPNLGGFDAIRQVLDSTHFPLIKSANFDVTSLDKDFVETPNPMTNWIWYHEWPIKVYNESVLRQNYYRIGFPYSMEQNYFQEDYYPEALKGHWCQAEEFGGAIQNRKCVKLVSVAEAGATFVENNIVQPAKDVTNAIIDSVETSTTGVINFISELDPMVLMPDSINNNFSNIIHLQTGSPSWIKFNLTITKPVNFLEFKSVFPAQGGKGAFVVFVDGEKIFSRQSDFSETGKIYQDRVGLPEMLTEGNHTVILRLDSISEEKSDIYVADLHLGMQSVEEEKDNTAPEITIITPKDGENYTLNSTVTADWSATDEGSGIDTATGTVASGSSIDTRSIGQKEFTVTATDKVGNSTTKAVKYNVVYDFGGLQDPLKEGKTLNSNSTVPVQFQLKDVNGEIIADAIVKLMVDEKEAVSSGNSNDENSFRYDSTTNQYIYNLSLKSFSLKAGEHKLEVVLDDGTTYSKDIVVK